MTVTQDSLDATMGVQDFGIYKDPELGALDDINTADENINVLNTNEEPTECESRPDQCLRS